LLCPKCKKNKPGIKMFQCDKCDKWFHPECCSITEEEANVMAQMGSWEKWFCPECEKTIGASSQRQNKRIKKG